MKDIINIPAVTVRFLPATNTLGSRVSVTLPCLGRSKVLPYDHRYSSSTDNAVAWLREQGVQPVASADLGKGVTVLTFGVEDHTALFRIFCRN